MAPNEKRGAPAKGDPAPCLVQLDGEPLEYTPPPPKIARVILRTTANDDGHFSGLEVVR